MLIVCPSCASEYSIGSDHVGTVGRKVRCAACRTTWFAEPQPLDPQPEVEGADAPLRLAVDEASAEPSTQPVRLTGDDAPTVVIRQEALGSDLSVEAENRRTSSEPPSPPASWGKPRSRRKPGLLRSLATSVSRIPRLPAALTCALVLAGGALLAREDIVRAAPQTAQLYAAIGLPVNLRGVAFKDVAASLESEGRERVLVVTGTLENPGRHEREVGELAFSVHGAEGPALYSWTNEAPRGTLAAGESAPFRTRLASPPADSQRVFVAFATREGATPAAPAR